MFDQDVVQHFYIFSVYLGIIRIYLNQSDAYTLVDVNFVTVNQLWSHGLFIHHAGGFPRWSITGKSYKQENA